MQLQQNLPAQSSPLQPFPNLGGVITTDDVSQKGTGSYKADYINWCRVSHLLQSHAPGWQFHLAHYVDSSHVWKAPNGTAYLIGYFTGPNGERTPDFPQAVMDNRNNPVAYEKVTARDLTDTHRRALAACSAFTFGLGWQLWAREEVENPHREIASAAKPASKTAAKIDGIPVSDLPLSVTKRNQMLHEVKDQLSEEQLQKFCQSFRRSFDLPDNASLNDTFTAEKHAKWLYDNVDFFGLKLKGFTIAS